MEFDSELKHFQDKHLTSVHPSTGHILPLNLVALGYDFDERIGSRINLVSIDFVYEFFTDGMLFCLVYDKQPNGALPVLTDLFSSIYQVNHSNDDRFLFMGKFFANSLVDGGDNWYSVISDCQTSRTQTTTCPCFLHFDLMNLPTHYGDQRSDPEPPYDPLPMDIQDIRTGALYLVLFDPDVETTNDFKVYWDLSYSDL